MNPSTRGVVVALLISIPVVGAAQRPVAPPWRPPAYADTLKFSEIELRVGPDSALPATLTLPKGRGPFPGVVLVHGSGPNDRNEAIGPNRPFQDLAWGLASRGIAVLRYEKRTRVLPYSFMGKAFTVEDETVRDARDAAARLARRPALDPARIVVLGHSLGGILAPRIAAGDPGIAGIIIAEGAARTGMLDMMSTQLAYLRSLPGADTARLDVVRAQVTAAQATERSLTAADSLSTRPIMGIPASYFIDLDRYDPAVVARTLTIPILVLQGGRDYQVTPQEMREWRTAVGDRPDLTIRAFPTSNHLMIVGSGTPGPAEYANPGHVSPDIVDAIAGWVAALTPPAAPHP